MSVFSTVLRHRSTRSYFVCYHGERVQFDCAAGLHWNQATENCDVPANAKCE